MGRSPRAHLAYGFNLGGSETGWKLVGVDEYGTFEFDWTEGGYGFGEDVRERLIVAAGFTETRAEGGPDWYSRRCEVEKGLGVEVEQSGHSEYPGWLLVAQGSKRSVEWSDAMTLDPAELAADRPEWDAALTAALTALGITPTQDGPAWLVFPSYG